MAHNWGNLLEVRANDLQLIHKSILIALFQVGRLPKALRSIPRIESVSGPSCILVRCTGDMKYHLSDQVGAMYHVSVFSAKQASTAEPTLFL